MDFTNIINQMIVLFLLLSVGYVLNKIDILDDFTRGKMSSFVVRVSSPALIISTMINNASRSGEVDVVFALGIAFFTYFILILCTFLVPKVFRVENDEIGIYKFMIMFSNVGFMGFPVIEAIYGEIGIIYASLFNLPFYLFVYTIGIYFVALDGEKAFDMRCKQFINAGVMGVVIGVFLFVTKIQPPVVITQTLDMIGSMTSPLAMLIIGAALASIPIKEVFDNKKLYLFSIIKLIVFPVIMLFGLKNFVDNNVLLGVAIVITGMPVAANAVMLSKEYKGNEKIASKGVFISTVMSIISIPILVFILEYMA